MSKHQRQSGWLNAYDVASPLSQAAEKRTRRSQRQHADLRAIVDARLRELGLWDAASSAGGEACARAHKAACIRSFSDAF